MRKVCKVKVFALLMSILLLTNLGLSVAIAANNQFIENGNITITNYTDKIRVESGNSNGGGSATIITSNDKGYKSPSKWYFNFVPRTSGVYSISVYYENLSSKKVPVNYYLSRAGKPNTERKVYKVEGFENTVCLAVKEDVSSYQGLPSPTSVADGNTDINVILEDNYTYGIKLAPQTLVNGRRVIVSISKQSVGDYVRYSNVPSSYITMGVVADNDNGQQSSPSGSFKSVNLTTSQINAYIKECGLQKKSDEQGKNVLESLLVDTIIMVGQILLFIAESSLNLAHGSVGSEGYNTNLTIDKLIFNKIEGNASPIIDLRGLGGIKLNTGNESAVLGILSNATVTNTIGQIFFGLRKLAIVIYIISLLYIGLKNLINAGTTKEAATKKYLEYWFTGAALLFIIPYFLPLIPYISNRFIAILNEFASTSGQFSVTYISQYLGTEFFGEDADVVSMRRQIQDRIQILEDIRDNSNDFKVMSQAEIDSTFESLINSVGLSGEEKDTVYADLKSKFYSVMEYMNQNADSWTPEKSNILNARINEMVDLMYNNSNITKIQTQSRTSLIETTTTYDVMGKPVSAPGPYSISKFSGSTGYFMAFRSYLDTLLNNIKNDRGQKDFSSYPAYEQMVKAIKNGGLTPDIANVSLASFQTACALRNNTANLWRSKLTEFFNDYQNTAVAYKLDTLEKINESLTQDPMVSLKTLAKTEHRVVYAIAWLILLFQLFALLFMYYKRLFVVIILICIFPLVMAMYAIDKLGDGKAQSLQNWFKEFIANIIVQFLHASIYISLINLGIDICRQDPARNWFFLIMCVLFLFPAEKMIRGFAGLQSSTIGDLKLNIVGGIVAMKTLGSQAKNLGVGALNKANAGAKNFKDTLKAGKDQGLNMKSPKSYLTLARQSMREDMKQEQEKAKAKKNERRRKKQERHDSRDERRRNKLELEKNAREIPRSERTAREQLRATKGAVKDATKKVTGTVVDKAKNTKVIKGVKSAAGKVASATGKVATKVKNSKVVQGSKKVASKVANSKVAKGAARGLKAAGKVGMYGARKLKNNSGKIAKNYGKAIRATAAAVAAMDTIGTQGVATGLGSLGQISGNLIKPQRLNTGKKPDGTSTYAEGEKYKRRASVFGQKLGDKFDSGTDV